MRVIILILSFCLIGCNSAEIKQKENRPLNRYWISKHLEPYMIDSAFGGGQTLYGSGNLLRLDSNSQAASLGADFYWKNDSLYQGGEPGMTVKFGSYKEKGRSIIFNQKLLAKDIMLTSDRIGQIEVDTAIFQGDSLLIYKRDTLYPIRKQSNQLEVFLNGVITFHLDRNGS